MTDTDPTTPEADCDDAREAADMGEKPDLGHKADTLIDALDGSPDTIGNHVAPPSMLL